MVEVEVASSLSKPGIRYEQAWHNSHPLARSVSAGLGPTLPLSTHPTSLALAVPRQPASLTPPSRWLPQESTRWPTSSVPFSVFPPPDAHVGSRPHPGESCLC